MTAINLITIIFQAISALTRFVGEWSIRLARVVTHALSGAVRDLNANRGNGQSSRGVLTPQLTAEPPSFVLGSDITIKEAIHSHIIPPFYT